MRLRLAGLGPGLTTCLRLQASFNFRLMLANTFWWSAKKLKVMQAITSHYWLCSSGNQYAFWYCPYYRIGCLLLVHHHQAAIKNISSPNFQFTELLDEPGKVTAAILGHRLTMSCAFLCPQCCHAQNGLLVLVWHVGWALARHDTLPIKFRYFAQQIRHVDWSRILNIVGIVTCLVLLAWTRQILISLYFL